MNVVCLMVSIKQYEPRLSPSGFVFPVSSGVNRSKAINK